MLQKKKYKKNPEISSSDLIYTDSTINEILQDHSLIEKKFLGTMILFPQIISEITSNITKEDFHTDNYAELYQNIIDKYAKNENIDIANLTTIAKGSLLADLISVAGFHYEARQLAETIKMNAMLRMIFNASFYTIQGIEHKKDPKEIFTSLQIALEKSQIAIPTKNNDIKSILTELENERKTIKEKNIIGFPTWDFLDQLVYGLIVPHIWIVGGYTGTGKTFFVLQLIERILKNNAKVAIFSTENSRMRNILRLIGCFTGIHEIKILKSDLSNDESELVKQAINELSEKTIYVFDDVFQTSDIRMKLNILNKIAPIDVVMIDYIQQLNEKEDGYEQMRMTALDLQRISKEMNCAMIIVSQISNEGQKSQSLYKMHYKGAGEIGAIADVAIELKRAEKEYNTLGVMVKKVRHNIPGTLQFRMFTEQNRKNRNYIEEMV